MSATVEKFILWTVVLIALIIILQRSDATNQIITSSANAYNSIVGTYTGAPTRAM